MGFKKYFKLICIVFAVSIFFGIGVSYAQTMTVAPSKIVLNANGNDQVVQTIFGMVIPYTYRINDYSVVLSFDNTEICSASSLRYCYTDFNVLVGFDRETIQNHPAVVAMAGNVVTASITGWLTAINGDGDVMYREFTKYGSVEISKPGKK